MNAGRPSWTPHPLFRYLILVAAVTMQMCLGTTYAWSVFVDSMKEITGLDQGSIQWPVSLFYISFPVTVLLAGSFLRRLAPWKSALLGAFIYGAGWMLAGFGEAHFGFTLIGVGIFAGIGVGLSYIVPISVCIRWFPKHKGLVTGIAVAGFGGGAALLSHIGEFLMEAWAFTPFEVFRLFGLVFLFIISASGLAMQNPPSSGDESHKRIPLGELLRQPYFVLLFFGMAAGLTAGLSVNANIKQLRPLKDESIGVWAVSAFAITNSLGRVIWGFFFDRFGSNVVLKINLGLQGLLLLLSPFFLRSPDGLIPFTTLVGLNYGGVLVLFASSTARHWGAKNVGEVYRWVFASNIPASLAPILAGESFDLWGDFIVAFTTISVFLGVMTFLIPMQTGGGKDSGTTAAPLRTTV